MKAAPPPAGAGKGVSRWGGLVGGSAIYLLTNLVNASVPFALLPILTRQLTAAEYGQVAMFQILTSALGALTGLNVHSAASRKYFDLPSEQDMAEFVGTCVQILAASALLTLAAIWVLRSPLANATSLAPIWVILAVPAAAGSFLGNLRLVLWQVSRRPMLYGTFQIAQSAANFVLSVVLIVSMGMGAAGRITAQIAVPALAAAAALWLLRRDRLLLLGWNPRYWKEALGFGVPLVPHVLGLFLLAAADRIVIHARLGLRDVGIYTVAAQLALGLSILFDAINKAYMPWLFEQLQRNDPGRNHRIVRLTYVYFAGALALAAVAFLLGPVIVPLIAGDNYREAGYLLGWLALGQAFGGMYLMVTNYVFYSKRTGLLSLTTLGAGAINLALLVALVRHSGLKGAAMAFAIAMALRFLLTWAVAQYRHSMPWTLKVQPTERQ